MPVVWLDIWEKIREDGEGSNDSRKKESVRRGFRLMLVYRGHLRKMWIMMRGELQCEQVVRVL